MSSSIRKFLGTGFAALIAIMLLLTAACGDDDDDGSVSAGSGGIDTAGQPGAGTGGAVSAGASGASGGASGGTAGIGGTAGTMATNIPEGSECGLPSSMVSVLGVCQQPSAPCEGGTPDKFDLKSIVPAAVSAMIPPFPASANCQPDLVCCINTDTCDQILPALQSSSMGGMMSSYIHNISCVPTGTCTGENPTEMAFGCPSSQSCCVDVATVTLPDAGLSLPDAG